MPKPQPAKFSLEDMLATYGPPPAQTRDKPSGRGFASMAPEKVSRIASLGGKAAHKKGTAHTWTSEEAIAAGRKGGTISRGGRGRLPEPD